MLSAVLSCGRNFAQKCFPKSRSTTIRRRLIRSFLTILVLFGLNLAVYSVSNIKRRATVEALRRAISSQILIAEINQGLNDPQKQMALLGEAVTDSAAPASRDEIANFSAQLQSVKRKIQELRSFSDETIRDKVDRFAKDYEALSASWLVFYRNFGVHHATAITELAMRADPISQRLLQQTVPEILDAEKKHVEATSATFYAVGAVADRIAAFIFLFSALIAI